MKIISEKDAIMFLENTLYVPRKDYLPKYKIKHNHWIKEIIKLLEYHKNSK